MNETIIYWPADRPIPKPGSEITRPVAIPGVVRGERLIAGRPDFYPRQIVVIREERHGK